MNFHRCYKLNEMVTEYNSRYAFTPLTPLKCYIIIDFYDLRCMDIECNNCTNYYRKYFYELDLRGVLKLVETL